LFANVLEVIKFYFGFNLKNLKKRLANLEIPNAIFYPIDETKFAKPINFLLSELKKEVIFPDKWLEIYVLDDYLSHKMISFGSKNKAYIFLTQKILENFLSHAKDKYELCLAGLKSVFIHEITHISYLHHIAGDYSQLNKNLAFKMIAFYANCIMMVKFLLKFILPFSFWRKFLDLLFFIPEIIFKSIESIVSKIFLIYDFIIKKMTQNFEKISDKNSIAVVGDAGFRFSIEEFEDYSSVLSYHKDKATRLGLIILQEEIKLDLSPQNHQSKFLICYILITFYQCIIFILMNNYNKFFKIF
jgi:hypothetical protein